jgi:hypothetical protein
LVKACPGSKRVSSGIVTSSNKTARGAQPSGAVAIGVVRAVGSPVRVTAGAGLRTGSVEVTNCTTAGVRVWTSTDRQAEHQAKQD